MMLKMRIANSASAMNDFGRSSKSRRSELVFTSKKRLVCVTNSSKSSPNATVQDSKKRINNNTDKNKNESKNENNVIRFRCAFEAKLSVGEELFVCGSNEFIGNWSIEGAFKLSWSDGNVWRGNIPISIERDSIESGTAPCPIEFKLVIKKQNGDTYWEKGENRAISFHEIEGMSDYVEVSAAFNAKELKFAPAVASSSSSSSSMTTTTVQSNVVDFVHAEGELKEEEQAAATKSKRKATQTTTKTSAAKYRTIAKVKYDNSALLKFDEMMANKGEITKDEFQSVYAPENLKMTSVEKKTVEFLLSGGGGKFSYSLTDEAQGYAKAILI